MVGGDTPHQGRLEMRLNNETWRTFKGNSWTSRQASVACRSLGFSTALSPDATLHFRRGTGLVHPNNLRCIGDETSLIECEIVGSVSETDDSHDVGLHCLPSKLCYTIVYKITDCNKKSYAFKKCDFWNIFQNKCSINFLKII